jgi:hypothetical protein
MISLQSAQIHAGLPAMRFVGRCFAGRYFKLGAFLRPHCVTRRSTVALASRRSPAGPLLFWFSLLAAPLICTGATPAFALGSDIHGQKARPQRVVERLIERSENQLRDARFEAALESANTARALLDASPSRSQTESRVRIEIVSATAAVALGDDAAARSSLERALQANSDLTLDPALVSPKVLRVLRAARQHAR